ncbi:glycosyltransferase family 4 protein [Ramlibacter sp. AN1133]|uniref:glycosyltransferase family 4 protein n=1 Tax=Ramlibacter sp. AN1133 TaxID=3133429 RepID=UPI0030BF7842
MSPIDRFPAGGVPSAAPRAGFLPLGERAERVLFLCACEGGAESPAAAAAARYQAGSRHAVTVLDARELQDARGRSLAPADLPPGAFRALVAEPSALDCPQAAVWLQLFAGVRVLLYPAGGGQPRGPCDAVVAIDAAGLEAGPVDDAVAAALQARGLACVPEVAAGRPGRNVLVVVPHRPRQDPRLNWIAHGAAAPVLVHQLGVHDPREPAESALDTRGALVRSHPTARYAPGEAVRWRAFVTGHAGAQAAVDTLLWMERVLQLRGEAYLEAIGAWANDARAQGLRWVLQHFLDVSATLVRQASPLRNVDAVVAADLPALPGAFILGALFRVPVVFDAHEFWPEADLGAALFEQQLWQAVERRLVRHAALRATVSPGLAALMQRLYGVPFLVLPNAEPRSSALAAGPAAAAPRAGPCRFLFQGGFARGRGIELLIAAWPRVREDAQLVLRGPAGEWRDRMIALARGTGLLERRIFFPPAVAESEMIAAAAGAEVGLVPYEPQGANHRHCCPNKMSQYMAAGLPILANDTSFVREVVQASGAGLVVDFSDADALAAAVDRLAADAPLRQRHALQARRHFDGSFHWEALSAHFYEEVSNLLRDRPVRELQVFSAAAGVGDNSLLARGRKRSPGAGFYRGWGDSPTRLAERLWRHTPEPLRRLARPLAHRVRVLLVGA